MADEIKPGDVVKVKSGGPKMTVSQVGETSTYVESAWCNWFDEKNKNQEGVFPLTTLVKVEG